jgi:hypothetical protein
VRLGWWRWWWQRIRVDVAGTHGEVAIVKVVALEGHGIAQRGWVVVMVVVMVVGGGTITVQGHTICGRGG